jgi:hypothetical protein
MFKKKKPEGALVKAATTIGKTAGKLVAVVGETAEKAKALTPTKKSKAKAKRKTAKKPGAVSKIKGLIAKSKK